LKYAQLQTRANNKRSVIKQPKKEKKKKTYNRPRVVAVPISVGMVPVSWLANKKQSPMLVAKPIWVGIEPVSWFTVRRLSSKREQGSEKKTGQANGQWFLTGW